MQADNIMLCDMAKRENTSMNIPVFLIRGECPRDGECG